MDNQTYWNERSALHNEKLLAMGDRFEKELALEYEKAFGRISKEIEAFYTQFAKDNEISYIDAKQMLTTSEKRRFMLEVDEYIKAAEKLDFSPKWDKMLLNASTAARVTRLQALQLQMRYQVETLYSKYNTGMTDTAEKIFTEGYYESVYDIQRTEGYGSPFATLDTESVKKAVARPWAPDGTNFSKKIWEDREGLVNYLNKEITQAFIRGEGSNRLIKEIQRKFGVTSKNAARLVQTEMSYFATAAKLESYKAMGFTKYVIVATIDGKTSVICKDMHKQVFNIDDYAPGTTAPPFHPRCRTGIAPCAESRKARLVYWENNRAYVIPQDMTYDKWLKEHVAVESAAKKPDNPNFFENIDIDDIDKKLLEYENSIIKQDFESSYVIQPNGDVYLFEGEQFQVILDNIDFDNAIILHNHPLDDLGLSDSFSRDDIDFMKSHPKVGEYYLVGGKYEYRLKIIKEIDLAWQDIFYGGMELSLKYPDEDSPQHFMMKYLEGKGYIEYERKTFNSKTT